MFSAGSTDIVSNVQKVVAMLNNADQVPAFPNFPSFLGPLENTLSRGLSSFQTQDWNQNSENIEADALPEVFLPYLLNSEDSDFDPAKATEAAHFVAEYYLSQREDPSSYLHEITQSIALILVQLKDQPDTRDLFCKCLRALPDIYRMDNLQLWSIELRSSSLISSVVLYEVALVLGEAWKLSELEMTYVTDRAEVLYSHIL